MSNYSSSNYDSFQGKDSSSVSFSVTSSNYYASTSKQKFQQLRHSVQPVSSSALSVNRSVFDLTNPNYLVGNNHRRTRSASPERNPTRTHIKPYTAKNSYGVPIPATLIRPPLISAANKSRTSLDSRSTMENRSADSLPSVVSSRPTSVGVEPLFKNQVSEQRAASPTKVPSEEEMRKFQEFKFASQSAGIPSGNVATKHLSLMPNSSYTGITPSGSTYSISLFQGPRPRPQPPLPPYQDNNSNGTVFRHEKTYSVPAINLHSRTKSNISLVNSNEYIVQNRQMNANALLDFHELNELAKQTTNDSRSTGKSETNDDKGGKKKKHRFWPFGLKKKSNDKAKKTKSKKKGNTHQVVEDKDDVESFVGLQQEHSNDKWFASSSEVNEVPIIRPHTRSPLSDMRSAKNETMQPLSNGKEIDRESINSEFYGNDTTADDANETRLLADISAITIESENKKEIAQPPKETKPDTVFKTSIGSPGNNPHKRQPVTNIYNFDNYSPRKLAEDDASLASGSTHRTMNLLTPSSNRNSVSFKNQIQETQYQDLIRKNIMTSAPIVNKSNETPRPMPDIPTKQQFDYSLPNGKLCRSSTDDSTNDSYHSAYQSNSAQQSNERFKVNSQRGYIVFAAESESLNMGSLPISERSDSFNMGTIHETLEPINMSTIDKTTESSNINVSDEKPNTLINANIIASSNTVIRHWPVPPPRPAHFQQSFNDNGSNFSKQRDFSMVSSSTTTSSSSGSEDPRLVYSPINDTFSIQSNDNSSLDTVSTLETKEISTSDAYNVFTRKAEAAPKVDNILEEDDTFQEDMDVTQDVESVYSELDSEFVIRNEYSIADAFDKQQENTTLDEVDQTHILEPLKEQLKTITESDENEHSDQSLHNASSYSVTDYEDLIKDYTYELSAEPSAVNSRCASGVVDTDNMLGNKSLELIHYYELNSSKSTFRHFSGHQNLRQGQQSRDFTGNSLISNPFEERSPHALRVVNSAERTPQDTAVDSTCVSRQSTINIGSRGNIREFSFASSIASDVQFLKNIAAQNQIQLDLLEEVEGQASRNFSLSDSSVLYYSDSDLVKNPVFSDHDNEDWESVDGSSRSNSSASVGGSTLLSAVNSLYGDYIRQKGYRDIEELCEQNTMLLPEAIKQIKLESAEKTVRQKGNAHGSVYSSNKSLESCEGSELLSLYSGSLHNKEKSSLANFFQSRRTPLVNSSTSYQYSYHNM